LFPTQGGLRKNIEYAIPRKLHITKDNGFGIYDKLDKYAQSPEEFLPDVYDALNCNEGCVSGAACVQDQNIFELDKAKYISNSSKSKSAVTPQREDYDSAFKKYDTTLDPAHFIREYKPVDVAFPQITDKDIEKAYELLGSPDYRKQGIDCSACGSETCYEMARKIALEVNIPGNCMIKAMDDARTEHINYVIAHEQLLEAIDVAKEASRAKTDFLASMSHEIRTPMNAIIGMAELLEHEPLNSRQKGFVHDIGASAHSLLGIINDILDMSKIESGKLELNPVDYCLGSLTDNIASMFTYVANDKGLEFKVETDTDLPYCLYGDDIRLKQILTNICGNAVKFTEKGYIKLAITANNGKLTFKVEDTGMGIRTEDLPKLFKVFEQVDKYKNRNVVGTGLGLSISRSFAKMMGGEITVESKYGQGTTFTITIPIVPGNAENILKKDIDEGEQFLSAPDAKILVTDDNEFNLKVACGLLGLIDIEADTAESGAKAIELVKKNDYDIVFMDQMMPEMDGIEALREIRKLGGKYENLAVVALTANAVKSAREMLLDCGFNDFLAKPIDTAKLHDVIKKYLPPDKLQKNTDLGKPEDRGKKMDDLHRKAIVTFVKENRNTYKDIEDSLNSGDIKTAHRIAHTLKSSAGYLGKKALQEAALSLEMSLQAVPTRTDKQPLLYTEDQLDALRSELEQAIREFEPVFLEAEAEKPSAVQVDSEKLDAVLSGLEPLLRKGDFGAVDFVEELQGIAGMEELAEKIDDYDFEGALVLLEKIMKDGAQ
jgi:signal transduction histidine kinase/CheY-like chemotaxis protein